MNAPGKNLLKIAGALLLIGGILSSIISAIMTFGVVADMTGFTIGGQVIGANSTVVSLLSALVALAASILQMFTGIWGVQNCQNTQKGRQGVTLGIITLVLNGAFLITSALGAIFGSGGLIVTAIFLIGAFKNKAAA